MRSISILSLAAVSALAIAPSAFAQDTTYTGDTSSTSSSTMPTSGDTASGKHWAVVGGVALLNPKNNPAPGPGRRWRPGTDAERQLLHQRQLGR